MAEIKQEDEQRGMLLESKLKYAFYMDQSNENENSIFKSIRR